MNNKYIATLLCITVLTFAPACNKKKTKSVPKTTQPDEIRTTIELDTTVFELEETESDQKSNIKF